MDRENPLVTGLLGNGFKVRMRTAVAFAHGGEYQTEDTRTFTRSYSLELEILALQLLLDLLHDP